MRVIADLHIHGRYSRATSSDMNLERIARLSKMKGLTIVGTGYFTHPKWLYEIKNSLVESDGSGLYKLIDMQDSSIYFMITGEVSTVFEFEGKTKSCLLYTSDAADE